MGQDQEDAERVPPQDPVRRGAHNVAETGPDITVQSPALLHLSGVQDERQTRHTLHHRPLHQFRDVHHVRFQPAREALDQ